MLLSRSVWSKDVSWLLQISTTWFLKSSYVFTVSKCRCIADSSSPTELVSRFFSYVFKSIAWKEFSVKAVYGLMILLAAF